MPRRTHPAQAIAPDAPELKTLEGAVDALGMGSARPTNSLAAEPESWASRYLSTSVALLALAFIAFWLSGYTKADVHNGISYIVADGWCAQGKESVGDHCFGDYAIVDDLFKQGNPWSKDSVVPTEYPALAWVPARIAHGIGSAFGSYSLGRNLYLAAASVSVLSPALWVAWSKRRMASTTAVAIAGVATTAFITTIDRGNAIAFAIGPAFFGVVNLLRGREKRASVGIVVAALMKPQFILLSALFLLTKRVRMSIATALLAGVGTLAGFLSSPSSFPANIFEWIRNIAGFSKFRSLDDPHNPNLGISRSIATVLDLSGISRFIGPDSRRSVVQALSSGGTAISAIAVALTVWALWRWTDRNSALLPVTACCVLVAIVASPSFAYYSCLALFPAALILRSPSAPGTDRPDGWHGMLDEDGSRTIPRGLGWLIVISIAVVLSPLYVPSTLVPVFSPPNARELVHAGWTPVGPLQLLWGPLLLATWSGCVLRMIVHGRQEASELRTVLGRRRSRSMSAAPAGAIPEL